MRTRDHLRRSADLRALKAYQEAMRRRSPTLPKETMRAIVRQLVRLLEKETA